MSRFFSTKWSPWFAFVFFTPLETVLFRLFKTIAKPKLTPFLIPFPVLSAYASNAYARDFTDQMHLTQPLLRTFFLSIGADGFIAIGLVSMLAAVVILALHGWRVGWSIKLWLSIFIVLPSMLFCLLATLSALNSLSYIDRLGTCDLPSPYIRIPYAIEIFIALTAVIWTWRIYREIKDRTGRKFDRTAQADGGKRNSSGVPTPPASPSSA
jgi:hypothetical protein